MNPIASPLFEGRPKINTKGEDVHGNKDD